MTAERIPILCVRQPWAHAIVHLGKDVENRTWSTRYRGPLLIHATKTRDPDEAAGFMVTVQHLPASARVGWPSVLFMQGLQYGGVIGQVELVDVVWERSRSPWAVRGHYHWVLRNPQTVPFQRMRGARGHLFYADGGRA